MGLIISKWAAPRRGRGRKFHGLSSYYDDCSSFCSSKNDCSSFCSSYSSTKMRPSMCFFSLPPKALVQHLAESIGDLRCLSPSHGLVGTGLQPPPPRHGHGSPPSLWEGEGPSPPPLWECGCVCVCLYVSMYLCIYVMYQCSNVVM